MIRASIFALALITFTGCNKKKEEGGAYSPDLLRRIGVISFILLVIFFLHDAYYPIIALSIESHRRGPEPHSVQCLQCVTHQTPTVRTVSTAQAASTINSSAFPHQILSSSDPCARTILL